MGSISYMILAPQLMAAEKDPKKAAAHCFNSIELDPENYRIGHTKASTSNTCGFPLDISVGFGFRIWMNRI